MTFDTEKIAESKAAYRRKLAGLSFREKLRILDAMRERDALLGQGAQAKRTGDAAQHIGNGPGRTPPGPEFPTN